MVNTLQDLLGVMPEGQVLGRSPSRVPISALCCDSRVAGAGTLFFCLVGKTSDGHDYAEGAYLAGCRAFVVERPLELGREATQIVVPDSRAALADAAAELYGHPERDMRLIGLTGTKGKTTTALLIRHLLCEAGVPTGYIGTNGVEFGGHHFPTRNSTPESLEIYRYLDAMRREGVETCVMEISSQALWMGRTRGLVFDTTLFTNLSRDHIGGVEHSDLEHYRACKRMLFADYPAAAVVGNAGDPATAFMLAGAEGRVDKPTILSFGTSVADGAAGMPLWRAHSIRPARSDGRIGVEFECLRDGISLGEPWFLPLPGEFNVQNALAALTVVCERFGVEPARARELLAGASVPGRFETVRHPGVPEVTFVIDYAHNGVSLSSILDALRAYEPKRLIVLFGSVGGRTKERRRDLALAAAERAELCILTSDNPACEPPMDILREIDAAFPAGACPRILEPDRETAIRRAVDMARPGDIILLAGKGHETYQLIGTRHEPFSELEILRDALEERASVGV